MDQARLSADQAAEWRFPPFVPRAPWWGGDLQTLSGFFIRHRAPLDDYPQERLTLPLADGSGDALSAALSRPKQKTAKPLVVLIHGLSGHEDSFYMRNSAAHLLAQGYTVLRLNVRGAGPSRPLCRLYYHAGRSLDLELAFAALPSALTAQGLVVIGYSLGANVLLKYLGERGTATPVRAAVSVSAPLDLAGTSRRLMQPRSYVYQQYMLRDMRIEAVSRAAEVTAAERAAIRGARTIWEFDHRFTAPRNRYPSAEAYYADNSSERYLNGIAVPTLIVYGLDDPWIPADAYRRFDWRQQRNLVPLLSESGGHVGFQGSDRSMAWHDRAIRHFLEKTLSRP
jgi:uncharacterized protein